MKKVILISLLVIFNYYNCFSQCTSTIDAGTNFSLAIKDDGSLWSWGANYNGQLGNGVNGFGSTFNVTIPTQVGASTDWEKISAGSYHSLAIKNDGTLWAWGSNNSNSLGIGTGNQIIINTPTQIGIDNNWQKISAGEYNNLAIKNDGTLWAWGSNAFGEVGNGTVNVIVSNPIQIGSDTDWQSIQTCYNFSLAIKNDGTLWAWGINSSGQFGNGTTTDSNVPIQIGTDNTWVSIAGGVGYGLGIKSNGKLYGWGSNDLGQLGNGTNIGNLLPVQIGIENDWSKIYAGNFFAAYTVMAIKNNGTLWGWGNNGNGQVGVTIPSTVLSPRQITTSIWQSVSVGEAFTMGIQSDGSLFTWGWDGYGQLGNGSPTSNIRTPTLVDDICSLSINYNDTEKFLIYPNPTNGGLTITSESTINKIEIYDINGRLVLIKYVNSRSIVIDIEILQSGIYSLKILTPDKTIIKKVVRE